MIKPKIAQLQIKKQAGLVARLKDRSIVGPTCPLCNRPIKGEVFCESCSRILEDLPLNQLFALKRKTGISNKKVSRGIGKIAHRKRRKEGKK